MSSIKRRLTFLLAIILYGLLFYYITIRSTGGELDYTAYWTYRRVLFSGWLNTIVLSFLSLVIALLVGLVLYMMQVSRFSILNHLAEIHKTMIFGTPLMVIVIVAFYYIGFAFGFNSRFWVGVLTLALYIGAYIADIYKGAIDSIHVNQWQTAKMFGFSTYQTYRYVVFPQVMLTILPPLAGQFALTIKGSALLSYMATEEFLNAIKTVQANSFRVTEGFIVVTIGYLLITVPLLRLIRYLEKRANFMKERP